MQSKLSALAATHTSFALRQLPSHIALLPAALEVPPPAGRQPKPSEPQPSQDKANSKKVKLSPRGPHLRAAAAVADAASWALPDAAALPSPS